MVVFRDIYGDNRTRSIILHMSFITPPGPWWVLKKKKLKNLSKGWFLAPAEPVRVKISHAYIIASKISFFCLWSGRDMTCYSFPMSLELNNAARQLDYFPSSISSLKLISSPIAKNPVYK